MSGIKYTLLTDFVESVKSRLLAINGANVDRSQQQSEQTAQDYIKLTNGRWVAYNIKFSYVKESYERQNTTRNCNLVGGAWEWKYAASRAHKQDTIIDSRVSLYCLWQPSGDCPFSHQLKITEKQFALCLVWS